MKKNIRELDLNKMVLEYKQPLFRAKQLYRWFWKKSVQSFDQIINIPNNFKDQLESDFFLPYTTIQNTILSNDGTIKFLFKLSDGLVCEGVLIPQDQRFTACISSQVGCSLSCQFCATGKMKRARNILASEIFDQVFLIMQECKKVYGKNLTNIVYMGMGEPFLNYINVIKSIEYITNKEGLDFSKRRITLSTVGISKMIKKFAEENTGVHLAISLHAACDKKRNQIMAINETNNLKLLEEALKYYHEKTQKKVTYEYVMLNEVNDSITDAKNLVQFCKIIPSKVNLIEFNLVDGINFKKSNSSRTQKFMQLLKESGIIVNLRKSRGEDVGAACGQLVINKL
tara:strand:+ start:930 stop:1955 length:1026 start_codon:yes stop_codon:yes gene_type:complete